MDKLESLIGKLNHATNIILPAWYLLTRLSHLLRGGKKWVPHRLLYLHRQNLQLWMKLLQWVTENGIPIKNIVFNAPTVTLWSDSYKYINRGYNNEDLALYWYITPKSHGVFTLNLIKFLAETTSIYITTKELGPRSHIIAFTDIFIDLWWIYMALFDPFKEELHGAVSWWLGFTLISNKVSLHCRHIKWYANITA